MSSTTAELADADTNKALPVPPPITPKNSYGKPLDQDDEIHVPPIAHPEAQQHLEKLSDEEKEENVEVEVEKAKAAKRDLIGAPPKGTVVSGIEDDQLWAMMRKFDDVGYPSNSLPQRV
jgi:hypothetical protein